MTSHGDELTCIKSGTLELDWVIGRAGLPIGRIVELFGGESTGKTTLAIRALAASQHLSASPIYFETERKFDPHYARFLGMDTSRVTVIFPSSLEECFDSIESLIIAKRPALVVVDSLGGLVSKEQWIGDTEEQRFDQLIDIRIRPLALLASEGRTTILITNQLRELPAPLFGPTHSSRIGRALRHLASVRVELKKGVPVYSPRGDLAGQTVIISAVKNQVSSPYRKQEMKLMYSCPVLAGPISDPAQGLLDFGKEEKANQASAGSSD